MAPRRLLITTLAASLTISAGATLAHAAGEADRQFTFAVRLMQQGESDLAERALGEFLQRHTADPRGGDARYYLALLARKRGDLKAAQAHLQAVKNPLAVTPDAIHLLAGQLKLEAGDATGAAVELELVRGGNLPDQESRSVWAYLLGIAYRSLNNPGAAAKQFDTASEADSSVRGAALLELGKSRIALKQTAGAIEALTAAAAAKIDPEQAAEARSLAADLAYAQKHYERAAELYNQVITRHQTSGYFGPATLGLLRSLYAAGQDQQVVQQHEALRKLITPEAQAEALYLAGAAHIRLEQFTQAAAPLTDFYKRYGADHPLSGEVAYLYAVVFYHTDLDGFEKWYATLEKDLPRLEHRDDLRFLRAQAAVKRDKPQEAIGYLTPLIEETGNPYAQRALLQRAALLEQTQQGDKAAADYGRYLQRYGQDPKAGEAGRRAIDLAFASEQYPRVAELSTAWLSAAQGAKADAADIADIAVIAAVRFKLAVAQIKLGELDKALVSLDGVLASKPAPSLAAFAELYRGIVLASRAKPGTPDTTQPAIAALTAAMRGPIPAEQQVEAMRLVAQLHRMAGRDAQAVEIYEQLRQRQSLATFDTLTALWVGRELCRLDRHEPALAWLTAVSVQKDAAPEAIAESLSLAGQSYLALKQWDSAIETYRRLIGFGRGYGDQARLGLAQSLAGAGQVDEALEEFAGLTSAEASRVAATALLESGLLRREIATRLTRAGDTAGAAARIGDARRNLSRVSILYDLPQLGDVPLRAHLALAAIAAESGDREKARTHLEAITQRAETPWHSAARAELMLLSGQRGDAVFLLRKIVQSSSAAHVLDHARRRLSDLGETP